MLYHLYVAYMIVFTLPVQFERSFTRFPLAVGMGNHERDWPGTGDAFEDKAKDSGMFIVHELVPCLRYAHATLFSPALRWAAFR